LPALTPIEILSVEPLTSEFPVPIQTFCEPVLVILILPVRLRSAIVVVAPNLATSTFDSFMEIPSPFTLSTEAPLSNTASPFTLILPKLESLVVYHLNNLHVH
jgi:hypothetical protein